MAVLLILLTVHTSAQTLSTYSTPIVAVTVSLSVALPARADSFSGTGNPTLTTGDAPDSICPYGWRLPEISGDQSYANLAEHYGFHSGTNIGNLDTPLILSASSFPRSGTYNNYQTERGYYWTSTIGPSSEKYYRVGFMYFYSSRLDLAKTNDPNAGAGYSLRCLAR